MKRRESGTFLNFKREQEAFLGKQEVTGEGKRARMQKYASISYPIAELQTCMSQQGKIFSQSREHKSALIYITVSCAGAQMNRANWMDCVAWRIYGMCRTIKLGCVVAYVREIEQVCMKNMKDWTEVCGLSWHRGRKEFLHISNKWFGCFHDLEDEKGAFFTIVLLSNSNKDKYSAGTVICSAH